MNTVQFRSGFMAAISANHDPINGIPIGKE